MIGIAGQARRCVQSPGCFLLNMRGSLNAPEPAYHTY